MRSSLPLLLAVLAPAVAPAAGTDPAGIEFFEKKIRPVLATHCYGCHSNSAPAVKSLLKLDSREAILKGGSRGPAVVPGKPADSPLLKALRQQGPKMPPKGPLPDAVVADFEKWVALGAPAPAAAPMGKSAEAKLWSLVPPRKPALPEVEDTAWPLTDADRFILARLEAEGVRPAGDAEPAALLRRVTFDLTGLPPTPEEVDAFLKAPSPAAYEKVVDRLLASPAFGERWGRHWLDVARYAESNGNADNVPFPHAWRYRDYVIDAFNKDKPYDRFVVEQLAGDLLPATGAKQRDEHLVATGFLALMSKPRAQNNPNYQMDLVADQIEVTGTALLGMTIGCARCHDHKYDPVTTREYYALAGVFTSSDLLVGEAGKKGGMKKAGRGTGDLHDLSGDDAFAMGIREGTPGDCAICVRGESTDRGPAVPRGVPAALAGPTPPKMPTRQSGRLELARWIASPSHPLTARVMANRVWQHLFGRGIVPTVDNFGTLGEQPTHPELLDHLATRFAADGWSVKKLIRSLVLSRTYRLGSGEVAAREKDPDNLLFGRAGTRRLEAEALRDAVLAASGQLDLTRPAGSTATFGGNKKSPALQRDHRHRSIYLPAVRGSEPESMALFDAADPSLVTGARDVTTVPAQSLYLLNGPFVVAQSRHTARRVLDGAGSEADRAGLAWRLILSRPPSEAERDRATKFVAETTAALRGREKDVESAAWAALCQALFASAEFRYLD
jgi:hypothetical protein